MKDPVETGITEPTVGIIELTGDGTGWDLTCHLPKHIFDDDGVLDYSKMDYNQSLVRLYDEYENFVITNITMSSDETPFVNAKTTSIFSECKFQSNVEITFTYEFNLFQWIGYFIVTTYRKLIR